MRMFVRFALVPCLLACQSRIESPKPAPATGGLPPASAGTPPAAPTAPSAPSASKLTGTVIERIDAPPYSYLHLSLAGGGDDWAAVNQTQVKAGDKVTVENVSRMDGFESKTLKRRFDRLVFGNLAAAPAAEAAPAIGASHTAVAATPDVHMERAEGPDAATVAEAYAKKAALKDKLVAIRGKVVKYNGGIMGKNWLHLQDGSGSAAKGDYDMAVTTSDEAKVGDTVTVRGRVGSTATSAPGTPTR